MWPVWVSRIQNQVAQRSNQAATGQRSSANGMPARFCLFVSSGEKFTIFYEKRYEGLGDSGDT